MITCLRFVAIYDNFLGTAVAKDFSFNRCAFDIIADLKTFIAYGNDLIKSNRITGFLSDLFDTDDIALRNLILLSACCNYCIHGAHLLHQLLARYGVRQNTSLLKASLCGTLRYINIKSESSQTAF